MTDEKKEDEVVITEEDKKIEGTGEGTDDEKKSEEKQSEEAGFVKDEETVKGNTYNQLLRQTRETETQLREAKKKLEDIEKGTSTKKDDEEEEDEDDKIFPDDDKKKSNIEIQLQSVTERLNEKDEAERKKQRSTFFKRHPQYLNDKNLWNQILDELDNFDPKSKVPYYKQLNKAHRIISGESTPVDKAVQDKTKEMASESASHNDGAQKPANNTSTVDDREKRLAKRMPPGFVYTGKHKE